MCVYECNLYEKCVHTNVIYTNKVSSFILHVQSYDISFFPGEGFSHQQVLVPGRSVGRAGGSWGLLFLQLLLLAGELVCQDSILQLHARQGVLDVSQAGGLGSLELQCCQARAGSPVEGPAGAGMPCWRCSRCPPAPEGGQVSPSRSNARSSS